MCENHGLDRLDQRGLTDRRTLLRAGAGVTTVAALATFAPAEAGTTTTRTFSGHFDGVTTPDWHYLPIQVPQGTRRIDVSYEYTKTDTGLGFSLNVIDLGMFDPSGHGLGNVAGFRGWSGGARKGFTITRTSATPGYIAGPMTPGVWNVILGPVAIVPPGVDWKVTVTLTAGPEGPKFVPAPAPRSVPGRGEGWYRGDLHLHTVHSDGRWTQAELISAARAAGLDFINSSEHNTHSAGLTWGNVTPPDFLVITGEEITTRAGHWLAVGLPAGTWIDWRYRPADDQLKRFTDQVRGVGGLAVAAHPWVPIPSTKWDFGYDYTSMDAVEIWNGPWTTDDQFGVEHWHSLLVAGHFVPIVGDSDSHNSGQTVGLPHNVVHATSLSTGAIVEALKKGRSWIAESQAVDLSFTATQGSTTVSCGEKLGATATDTVTVKLDVTGAPGCVATVRGPAGILAGGQTDAAGVAHLSVDVPAAVVPFVRAEVRRPDGDVVINPLDDAPLAQMVALTNPIWL